MRLLPRSYHVRLRNGGLVAAIALVGTLTFGLTSAWAPPNTKWYSTAITAPNPANIPAGVATPVTVQVTNCGIVSPCTQNSTQALGSANLTFPAGLSVPLGVINASNITQANGKTWSADVVANANGTRTVRLRNPGPNTTNALAPGQSVSVTVDVTASCGPQPPIETKTKQSNDFSGNGNDFTRLGSEPALTVSPGSFAGFSWAGGQPDASQHAGTAFTPATGIKVTAIDGCGAVVTSYTGANAVFSGLHNSPNGTQPSYGFTWSNGVATSTTVTDYKAETTRLTVTDGAVTADSSQFTVAPGSLSSLAFTTGPDEWEPRAPGSFPVVVTASDTWGNGVSDQLISLAIDPAHNPGGATLTCVPASCQANTNSGDASFTVSLDKDGLGYELQATNGSLQANSSSFNIGDVKTCGANCQLNGTEGGSSASASVSGASGDLMALGFGGSIQTASGKCEGAATIGPGFEFVQAETTGGTTPSWTFTATLSKNTPGFDPSRGAAQWNICLGTINLTNPPPGPDTPCGTTSNYSWPANTSTGCAIWDPDTEMYWGDIPNAAPNVKKCDNQQFPVVLSKNKTGSGDLVIKFCVPYPWDGGGGWR